MAIKIKSLFIILVVLIISCKNQNKEDELRNSEPNEIVRKKEKETNVDKTKIDTIKIIEKLQGKWKENEYPYRRAQFVKSRVKFIEEGIAIKPEFEKFEVSLDCQFDNNNIKDIKSSDIILTLPENKRCEKINVSKDTLTLSGFSANTNEEYKIIYLKM